MLGDQFVSRDIDKQILLLEPLCRNPTFCQGLKGSKGGTSDRSDGNENSGRKFMLIKMLSECAQVFDTDGGLWAELDPDCACRGRGIRVFGSRSWSIALDHLLGRSGL